MSDPTVSSSPSQAADEHLSAGGWPHRLAVLLVCIVFPLIWVGGLVTSYNAGMAVPDWPTTYGYNLFLYPWTTWLLGPWDLFIEHGHRLLGAAAGLFTIALLVSTWRSRCSAGLRWAAAAALVLVIAQGLLGGARVLLNERQLAMIHGCTGPLFFVWCVGLAVCSSRWWRRRKPFAIDSSAADQGGERRGIVRLAAATGLIGYVQLVLGAQLRHASVMLDPSDFRVLVAAHLIGALVLGGHVIVLLFRVGKEWSGEAKIRRPARGLAILYGVQIALGIATWVVNYGWPQWSRVGRHGAGYTIVAEGWLQSNIVTAHVAMGTLILGVCAVLTLRAWRLAPATVAVVVGETLWKGAAA